MTTVVDFSCPKNKPKLALGVLHGMSALHIRVRVCAVFSPPCASSRYCPPPSWSGWFSAAVPTCSSRLEVQRLGEKDQSVPRRAFGLG